MDNIRNSQNTAIQSKTDIPKKRSECVCQLYFSRNSKRINKKINRAKLERTKKKIGRLPPVGPNFNRFSSPFPGTDAPALVCPRRGHVPGSHAKSSGGTPASRPTAEGPTPRRKNKNSTVRRVVAPPDRATNLLAAGAICKARCCKPDTPVPVQAQTRDSRRSVPLRFRNSSGRKATDGRYELMVHDADAYADARCPMPKAMRVLQWCAQKFKIVYSWQYSRTWRIMVVILV